MAGDTVAVRSQLLRGARARCCAIVHEMVNGETGEVAAVCELTVVHLDRATRRSTPLPAAVTAKARALLGTRDDRFTPKNPDFAARVRDSFQPPGRDGPDRRRDRRMSAAGACDIAVDFRPELSQQHGFFHGGLSARSADSAGGYAAFSLMPADASVLTVEYKINLLAPAQGARLIARGRVTKPGRTLTVIACRCLRRARRA